MSGGRRRPPSSPGSRTARPGSRSPEQVEADARSRLHWVREGELLYVVEETEVVEEPEVADEAEVVEEPDVADDAEATSGTADDGDG